MDEPLTLTAVFTPDENGWTMAQLAEWPAVVTCGRTLDEARAMLLDAAREMLASHREEGREPPIGTGHVEPITIVDTAASTTCSTSSPPTSTPTAGSTTSAWPRSPASSA